jgi:hypothetical protein
MDGWMDGQIDGKRGEQAGRRRDRKFGLNLITAIRDTETRI